jgi:hypothetical protein
MRGVGPSDWRLLGGLFGEPTHVRRVLSPGALEQGGHVQKQGKVRIIPKLLSSELAPLESIKGAGSKAIREISDAIQLRGAHGSALDQALTWVGGIDTPRDPNS